MSKAKRYYWLKLKEDFFEDDTIEWLEEQHNGKEYVLFYLKLCLKSLKTNGCLVRNVGQMLIPYDTKKIAEITHVDFDTAVVALRILQELGLIEILENGELYLTQLNNMVGSETDKAVLMRNKRLRDSVESEMNKIDCISSASSDAEVNKPSLKEVIAYAEQLGNGTDPYNFFTYYMQMGWKTKSGDPITDWKNTFRYWSANERDSTSGSAAPARRKKMIPESPNADAYRSLVYNLDEDGSSDRGVPYPETDK